MVAANIGGKEEGATVRKATAKAMPRWRQQGGGGGSGSEKGDGEGNDKVVELPGEGGSNKEEESKATTR